MKSFLKTYWAMLLIGLILRLVIAGFTFHPDVRTTALASASFFQSGNLDFYNQAQSIANQEILDDLSLSYLISLPFHFIFRPVIDINTERTFLNHQESLLGAPQLWFYLIYTKFPLILFDLALGILLFFCSGKRKNILYFWMFNPFTLWATEAIGQFDIYPTFFILLSYFFIKKNNLNWSALALGIGGAIKSSPFLLLPLLIGLAKTWKQRFQIIGLTVLPYLLTVSPYLPNSTFRSNALFAPQLSKMLYAGIPLSGGEKLLIVPALLLIIYLAFLSKKREERDFLNYSIVVLLSVLTFTHFHLQWFLWVMPLLLIWILNKWKHMLLPIIGLTISLIFMAFLFDSSLTIKLFVPIFPQLDSAVGLAERLSNDQVTFFRSLAATLFAGSSGFIVFKIFKEK